MKKLLPLLLAAVTLSGCWDYTEIKDQTIVAGISIDFADDGRYSVGLEILPMTTGEQDEIKPVVLSGKGVTIEEALYNITGSVSYLPYVSHAWLILISEEVGQYDIRDILDLIATHPDFYLGTYIAVVKNAPAVDAYGCETITAPIIAHEIANGFDADKWNVGKTTPKYAYQIFEMFDEEHLCYTIPALSVIEEEDGRKLIVNDGAAIFNTGTLKGYLDPQETLFQNIASDRIRTGIVGLEIDQRHIDFKIRNCTSRTTAEIVDGKPRFSIMVELDVSTKTMPGQFDFAMLEEHATAYFKDGIEKLVEKSKEMDTDYLKLSLKLHRQATKEWDKIKDDWFELFPDAECSVEVKVNVID